MARQSRCCGQEGHGGTTTQDHFGFHPWHAARDETRARIAPSLLLWHSQSRTQMAGGSSLGALEAEHRGGRGGFQGHRARSQPRLLARSTARGAWESGACLLRSEQLLQSSSAGKCGQGKKERGRMAAPEGSSTGDWKQQRNHLHHLGFGVVAAHGKAMFWALTSHYFALALKSQINFNIFFTSLAPKFCLILAVQGFGS